MWSNFVIYCVLPAHLNCASTGMNQERGFLGPERWQLDRIDVGGGLLLSWRIRHDGRL